MLKKMKAIWELTRLEHGLIFALSLIVSLFIAYHWNLDLKVAVAAIIAAIAAEMGAFALNDYYDVEVDRKNNRTDRPIVRGDITKQEALALTIASFIISLIAAFFIGNTGALVVVVVLILFSILYDYKLKEYGIWGNIYIAFSMAAPFLFSSMLFKNSSVLLLLAAIAFFIGLGREIMKGIQDMEGDALRDAKTIARVYGPEKAKYLAVALFLFGALLSPVPFLINIDPSFYRSPVYAVLIAAADLVLVYVCIDLLRSHDNKAISKARKTTLIGMMIALVAFLVTALL